MPASCSIDACPKPVHARGWCRTHYMRWKRTGTPEAANVQLPWPANLLERSEPQPNGCVHFTGATSPSGYGNVFVEGSSRRAHRAAYELFVGPIPDGLTIDHLCHNDDDTCPGGPLCLHRRCVNPTHLAPKSIADNTAASPKSVGSINAAKTHCIHGHPFDEDNTARRSNGHRQCKACWKREAA